MPCSIFVQPAYSCSATNRQKTEVRAYLSLALPYCRVELVFLHEQADGSQTRTPVTRERGTETEAWTKTETEPEGRARLACTRYCSLRFLCKGSSYRSCTTGVAHARAFSATKHCLICSRVTTQYLTQLSTSTNPYTFAMPHIRLHTPLALSCARSLCPLSSRSFSLSPPPRPPSIHPCAPSPLRAELLRFPSRRRTFPYSWWRHFSARETRDRSKDRDGY